MKKNVILSAIMSLLIASGFGGYTIVKKSQLNNLSGTVELVSVIDGDTIKIKSDSFGEKKVRLIGIDTPEKGECFYMEAKNELEKFLLDKEIKLEKDVSGVDVYDRLLRYVFVVNGEEEDDVLVNERMIREGFAFVYTKGQDKRYHDLFVSAEREAKKKKSAMWGVCDYLEVEEKETASKREVDLGPPSDDCIIKGNISEKGYGMTYLIPGCDNYNRVKIDVKKGEKYFCTEEEAVEAGFRKATNCP